MPAPSSGSTLARQGDGAGTARREPSAKSWRGGSRRSGRARPRALRLRRGAGVGGRRSRRKAQVYASRGDATSLGRRARCSKRPKVSIRHFAPAPELPRRSRAGRASRGRRGGTPARDRRRRHAGVEPRGPRAHPRARPRPAPTRPRAHGIAPPRQARPSALPLASNAERGGPRRRGPACSTGAIATGPRGAERGGGGRRGGAARPAAVETGSSSAIGARRPSRAHRGARPLPREDGSDVRANGSRAAPGAARSAPRRRPAPARGAQARRHAAFRRRRADRERGRSGEAGDGGPSGRRLYGDAGSRGLVAEARGAMAASCALARAGAASA